MKFFLMIWKLICFWLRTLRNLLTTPAFPIFLGKEAMVTLRREDGYPKGGNVHLENSQHFILLWNTDGYSCMYISMYLTIAELNRRHIFKVFVMAKFPSRNILPIYIPPSPTLDNICQPSKEYKVFCLGL